MNFSKDLYIVQTATLNHKNMTAKLSIQFTHTEMRTHTHTPWFPQPRKYYFQGLSIQDLKVINHDMCEKAYCIYSMYDLYNFYGTAPSSPLLAV